MEYKPKFTNLTEAEAMVLLEVLETALDITNDTVLEPFFINCNEQSGLFKMNACELNAWFTNGRNTVEESLNRLIILTRMHERLTIMVEQYNN